MEQSAVEEILAKGHRRQGSVFEPIVGIRLEAAPEGLGHWGAPYLTEQPHGLVCPTATGLPARVAARASAR